MLNVCSLCTSAAVRHHYTTHRVVIQLFYSRSLLQQPRFQRATARIIISHYHGLRAVGALVHPFSYFPHLTHNKNDSSKQITTVQVLSLPVFSSSDHTVQFKVWVELINSYILGSVLSGQDKAVTRGLNERSAPDICWALNEFLYLGRTELVLVEQNEPFEFIWVNSFKR